VRSERKRLCGYVERSPSDSGYIRSWSSEGTNIKERSNQGKPTTGGTTLCPGGNSDNRANKN